MKREKNDHFDGRKFINPAGPVGQPLSAVARMLMERRTRWPDRIDDPVQKPDKMNGASAVIKFIGHSTFLFQTAAGNILTDPMYSERASPLKRARSTPRSPTGRAVRGSAGYLDRAPEP